MRPVRRCCGAALALLMLSACANAGKTPEQAGASAGTPQGQAYPTVAAYFAELQQAALGADYQGFAQSLAATEPAAVVADLRSAFGGGPFDIYTLDIRTDATTHRRTAALRSTSGRLYLYFRLDQGAGGWHVGDYGLSPDKGAVQAHL